MKILGSSDAELREAATALQNGAIVAIPTETVYGLAASIWDQKALARVFEVKNRPSFDPLIVHVLGPEDAGLIGEMDVPFAREMARRFWPGPLTMVLPKKPDVPHLATAGLETVGVRSPSHPIARRIIELAGVPLAAPSANPFAYLSPTRAEHVQSQLGDKVDYLVDGGPCPVGVESTVLDLSAQPAMVLRPGAVSFEELARVLPNLEMLGRHSDSPRAPGQLPVHYAPRKPLFIAESGMLPDAAAALGAIAIAFGAASAEAAQKSGKFKRVLDLSPDEDASEAATKLFQLLHELDRSDAPQIWAELLPERGIGRAVNDRLRKGAGTTSI